MTTVLPIQTALSAPNEGPLSAYRALVATGAISADPSQLAAIERFQDLWGKLRGYDPKSGEAESGFLARFRRRKPVDEAPPGTPQGLYLVGEVGRGKSMLMDLFFGTADLGRKKRIHFHRFMQDAHARIFRYKQANPSNSDPIPPLADEIAAEAALLCFDEFQVNDIADAMILGRLFEALFERGVVIVATSNTEPDKLFLGQPGRDAFLPFIALIKRRLDLLLMDGTRDYRRGRIHGLPTWHSPADARATAALDAAFEQLSGEKHGRPDTLHVNGRDFVIPQAANGVARFDFRTLCGQAFGPGDYLALAVHFDVLVLDAIPMMSPDNFDEARRFITLIDALYDHRVKLVASAAAGPDALYPEGRNAKAFERTASRLVEMQSQDWLGLEHLT